MSLSIPIPVKSNGDGEPIHWPTLKAAVLARLNIVEEYKKLGVRFPSTRASEKGWVACHAIGREDRVPSAAVNVETGTYVDKGGEGTSKSFFNFALEQAGHPTWMACIRHYAAQVGVDVGHADRAAGGVVEAIHEYIDADGSLSYGVHKIRLPTGDKVFRQYPWRDGAWFKEKHPMDGVPPLPYRMLELLASREDEPCLWLEGEKDVDRAYEAGFVATTSHMGAGNFHHTGEKFLAAGLVPARDYVVIPDNDPKGRDHALEVAGALHGYLAAINPSWVVKVVPLPGVPFKGDLSDWFDLGGTPEELRALIDAAPAWEPGAKVEEPIKEPSAPEDDDAIEARICTLEHVAKVVSENLWVWEGWIPSEALTILAAQPGAGKTLLMMDLHRRALKGLPWPDGATMNLPPGKRALWIVADNHYKQMLKVSDEFGIPRDRIAVNAFDPSEPTGGTSLMTLADLDNLERNVRDVKPYWVVIDTITNTSDYKSQDSVDAKRQYKPLQEIALRHNVPIICITHLSASAGVLGRRAVEKARTVIMFSEPDRENQPDRRKVWVDKSFDQKPPALGVTVGVNGYEYDDHPPEGPDKADHATATKKPPKVAECTRWLKDTLGAGTQAVHELIDMAEEMGFGGKGTLYRARDKINADDAGITEIEIHGRKHWQLNFPD